MAEIEIKLKGLAQIKAELRDLKGELANATDPQQMAKLAEEAGKLKDQLKDANEQVAVFSTGSKFEQVSNSFGSMKDSLMSMDFEEAAQKAQMFQKTLAGISPKTIGDGIKGLTSVVGSLSKAFIQFGMALLANPIFLLVAAIVAIIAIIGAVMNKLGLLKPILAAVGKVFGWIGDVIDTVIQGLKDLTDWLGLTSHAANEAAQAQADAAEKTAKAHEEKSATIVQGYDHEINMAKINGKSTEYVEKKKAFWIMETMKARMIADKEAVKSAILIGDLDEEEIAKLKEKAAASTLAYKGQINATKELISQQSADKKKALDKDQEEQDKADEEGRKKSQEAYKKKIEAEKQYRLDRLAAIRQIEDLENSLMVDGITKELKLNEDKHKRILKDLENNEKLISSEKTRLAKLYAEEELKEEIAIRLKYQEDLDTALMSVSEKRKAEADAKVQLEADTYAKMGAMMQEDGKKRIANSEEQRKLDLANAESKVQLASKAMDAIGGLLMAFQMNNEKDAHKQFAINKALALGSAFVNTALAVTAALTAGGNPLKLATGQQFVEAGIAAAIGAANIVKIASSKFGGGGKPTATAGGGASSGGGGGTSTQAATPAAPQMFGANNNANTFGATGSQSNQPMVVKAVVVESDITSMQSKVNKIQQSAIL